jgi:hypothetical protein
LPLEAPYLGEHNTEVLARYLDYDADWSCPYQNGQRWRVE